MPEKIEAKKNYFVHHRRALLISAGIFLLLVIAVAAPLIYQAYASTTSAQQQAIQTKNAAISQAIVNNDYNTWSSLVTDPKLKAQVNASNFNSFAQAYRLLEQGKLDEADVIKQQIGLKQALTVATNKSAAISAAIASQDYAAWRTAVGSDQAPEVTADNFKPYAEMLANVESGKLNKATSMQYSLGLKTKIDYSSSH